MNRIFISKSPTWTPACDYTKVSKGELRKSSVAHINDVRAGMEEWMRMLEMAGRMHDSTKTSQLDWFHRDFVTGFKQQGWWDMHRKAERHHLLTPMGTPRDVNLIDVLEYITDCVMAGKARSGSVRELKIPATVLMKAFKNTAKLLAEHVVVQGEEPEIFPADALLKSQAIKGAASDTHLCGRHKDGVCDMDMVACEGACGEHAQRAVKAGEQTLDAAREIPHKSQQEDGSFGVNVRICAHRDNNGVCKLDWVSCDAKCETHKARAEKAAGR